MPDMLDDVVKRGVRKIIETWLDAPPPTDNEDFNREVLADQIHLFVKEVYAKMYPPQGR